MDVPVGWQVVFETLTHTPSRYVYRASYILSFLLFHIPLYFKKQTSLVFLFLV